MHSTMDQLQSLSNNELYLLCKDFHIAARQIAYLSRRQLERRLHVAIIGERAKMRARDLVRSVRYQQDHMYMQRWLSNMHKPKPILGRQMPLSSGCNFAASKQRIDMPTPQRFRGGVDYHRHLQPLAYYVGDTDTEQSQDDSHESDENEESEQDLKQHWQDAFEANVESRTAISTNYLEWDPTRESATDYYSCSASYEDNQSLTDDGNDGNQLQKAERFARWTTFADNLPYRHESAADSSSEEELCTINYLEEWPPDDQIKKTNSKELLDVTKNLTAGDTLVINLSSPRPRRSLWRYVCDLFWCDTEGKLDVGKLRYSIVCCAMVICTVVGIKMLP